MGVLQQFTVASVTKAEVIYFAVKQGGVGIVFLALSGSPLVLHRCSTGECPTVLIVPV